MAATIQITVPMAIAAFMPAAPSAPVAFRMIVENRSVAIAIPDTGLLEEPTIPTMRDETAAKKKPKIAIRTAPPIPTGTCGRTPVRTMRTARQITTTFMLIFLSVRSSLPPWPPASAFMESRKVVTIIGRDLMREMIPPVASAPAPM